MATPTVKKKNLALLEPHLTQTLLKEVRDVWFQHLEGEDEWVIPPVAKQMHWFRSDEGFDSLCVARFGPALEAIVASGATTAHDLLTVVQPRGPLDYQALILLLDQIGRNCFRGDRSEIVFRNIDPLALQITITALEQNIPDRTPDIRWRFSQRQWFYLPLMHSEALVFQEKCVEEFKRMVSDVEILASGEEPGEGEDNEFWRQARDCYPRTAEAFQAINNLSLPFAIKHRDIIAEFGRFPHRNKALGRVPTQKETAYLANGGETFGSAQ